jgi:hypothetical protein
MNASTERHVESNTDAPSIEGVDPERARPGCARRGARALILVVAWFATAFGLAIAFADVIVYAKYTRGGMIDGSAHEAFKLLAAGEVARRPNLRELGYWHSGFVDGRRDPNRQRTYTHGLKPSSIDTVPVLDANGAEVSDAPEFGFVRYSGMPEDPSVTLYLYDRDILAARVQWEDARPPIEERWRIFDEPRFIECLRAIEAAKPASSWTAQELSYSVWW